MNALRNWLRSNAGALWLRDVAERSGWTFVEVFAGAYGLQGLAGLLSGHVNIGLARTAATAGVAAVAAVVKGAVMARFKKGVTVSPASAVKVPIPPPPPGTDPGWSEPPLVDSSRRPDGALPRSSAARIVPADGGVVLPGPITVTVHNAPAEPASVSVGRRLHATSALTSSPPVVARPRKRPVKRTPRKMTPAQQAARSKRAAREGKAKRAAAKTAAPRRR